MSEELLPCPLCGSKAVVRENHRNHFVVVCLRENSCGCELRLGVGRDDVIKTWNKRATPSVIEGVSEAQTSGLPGGELATSRVLQNALSVLCDARVCVDNLNRAEGMLEGFGPRKERPSDKLLTKLSVAQTEIILLLSEHRDSSPASDSPQTIPVPKGLWTTDRHIFYTRIMQGDTCVAIINGTQNDAAAEAICSAHNATL